MTREFHPSVISLDIFLPDMQGWRILDRLKTDSVTRHIPICVVSTDDSRERALQAGAIGFLAKPLQSKDLVDRAVADLYAYCERPAKKLIVALPASPLRDQFLARDEITASYGLRYTHTFDRDWGSLGANGHPIPTQWLHSAALGYRVRGEQLDVSTTLEVSNLTDAASFDYFQVQRPGRAFYVKTAVAF